MLSFNLLHLLLYLLRAHAEKFLSVGDITIVNDF